VIDVYIEAGPKRVFACALEWPGWCRSGKSEDGALEALDAYRPRYAVVAAEARMPLPAKEPLNVVERLPGSANTDFGVPHEVAARDRLPLRPADGQRLAALVTASWAVLDRIVASAPAELRKGPRGGGRDRDKIVDHVLRAELVYARKVGLRLGESSLADAPAIAAMRAALIGAIQAGLDGKPIVDKGWPARYAARRIAWHVLDHGWEIEDRSA
jgi:hypothetical protein